MKFVVMKFKEEDLPLTDLFSYDQWLRFLSYYKNEKGRFLPRGFKDGRKIVYRVAKYGGREKITRMFPLDKEGKKLYLAKHGHLIPVDNL